MESSKHYDGKVCDGISCELHEGTSFSGKHELALMLEGQIIAIISIERKNAGKIRCVVSESRKLMLESKTHPKPPAGLDLDDDNETSETSDPAINDD